MRCEQGARRGQTRRSQREREREREKERERERERERGGGRERESGRERERGPADRASLVGGTSASNKQCPAVSDDPDEMTRTSVGSRRDAADATWG